MTVSAFFVPASWTSIQRMVLEIKPYVFQLAGEIDSFCAAHTRAISEASLIRIRSCITAMLENVPAGNPV